MDELIEAVRHLQANQIAQSRVLRALIASHPNPKALREAWSRYVSPSLADASLSRVSDPGREPVHSAMLEALQDWDERLASDLPAP